VAIGGLGVVLDAIDKEEQVADAPAANVLEG
jgi:hypothetical protein